MKELLLIIMLLFTTCGCNSNKEKINMIIQNDEGYFISIHYPTTNLNKIDKKIKNYVDTKYKDFKKNYVENNFLKPELNIDYHYFNNNKFLSIILNTYINSYNLSNAHEEVFIINYDIKEKKTLVLSDIIKDDKLDGFIYLLKEKLSNNGFEYNDTTIKKLLSSNDCFTFNDEYLTVCLENLKTIEIDISDIPLSIDLETEKKVYKEIIKTDTVVDIDKKVIALTFDDGPTKYTNEVLDILRDEGVVATFFVLGNKVESYSDTLRKAVSSGNEIGNHSYNHKWLSRLSKSEIEFQINETQEKVKQITGIYPNFLRPTYGSINSRVRSSTNLDIVLWDIDPKDWKRKSPSKISEDVIESVDDEKIILMHDNHKRTVDATKILIPKLKELGYQFVTLSELKEVKMLRNLSN